MKKRWQLKVNRSWSLTAFLCIFLCFILQVAWAQERITDQVAVTVSKERLLGIHRGEGIARLPLLAGEEILKIQSRGINGFVHTSLRLLGFSGTLQRWSELQLDVSELVNNSYVTPRMILVIGEKHLYGFQGGIGRWKVEDFRPRETLIQSIVKDHVAVFITSHQALGFSAFTGGFFPKDLPLASEIVTSRANDNIVLLILKDKQLLFRSGLAIWAELR